MMSSLATDEVWVNISWRGTDLKRSFVDEYTTIQKTIAEICAETFPECNNKFCENKIKSFLRHAKERIQRKKLSEIPPRQE